MALRLLVLDRTVGVSSVHEPIVGPAREASGRALLRLNGQSLDIYRRIPSCEGSDAGCHEHNVYGHVERQGRYVAVRRVCDEERDAL